MIGALLALGACGDPAPLPCDVAAVFRQYCGTCHGAEPAFGAPMSLTTWDDLHAQAPSGDGVVWEVTRARLDDTRRPMPPMGFMPLLTADRAILDVWFAAGAPARPAGETCPP